MASSLQNKKLTIVFFLSIVSFLWTFSPVFARADGDFSVSPLFTDLSLGETEQLKDFFLMVSNATSEPVVLRISLVDFGSLNESGGIAFLGKEGSGTNRYALASWITPEKDVVTLLPGAEEKVRFTIENKESLSPGGHYGAALFSIEKEGGNEQDKPSEVSVNSTFSALVFVKKEGGIVHELSLRDQSVDKRSVFSGLPSKISFRFQNSGNVDVVPRGRIILTDAVGRVVAKAIINEDSSRILPESFRMYRSVFASLRPMILPGWYMMSTEYRFDGEDTPIILPQRRLFAWGITAWWIVGLTALFRGSRRLTRFLKSKRNQI